MPDGHGCFAHPPLGFCFLARSFKKRRLVFVSLLLLLAVRTTGSWCSFLRSRRAAFAFRPESVVSTRNKNLHFEDSAAPQTAAQTLSSYAFGSEESPEAPFVPRGPRPFAETPEGERRSAKTRAELTLLGLQRPDNVCAKDEVSAPSGDGDFVVSEMSRPTAEAASVAPSRFPNSILEKKTQLPCAEGGVDGEGSVGTPLTTSEGVRMYAFCKGWRRAAASFIEEWLVRGSRAAVEPCEILRAS